MSDGIILCLSKPIIDKSVEILGRLGLQNKRELNELLALFALGFHVVFTVKTPVLQILEEDPDYNKFIECAVTLKADYIVSGNKTLTAIQEYMNIKIVTPKEFLISHNVHM